MVRVVCRLKPPLRINTKLISENELLFTKKDKDINNKDTISSKTYKLDRFYGTHIINETLFNSEIINYLKDSFYLFLYGHTGSGKTYTLFGNSDNGGKGLLYYIFKNINYNATVQCLELSSSGSIDLMTSEIVSLLEKNDKIKLHGISNTKIKNSYDYHDLLLKIKQRRKKGISKYNSESSRTHLLLNIFHNNKKYVIIDLAGNERKPEMLKGINYIDTNYINSSLLSLKECFRAHSNKRSYIPYRRSKLTRLLKNLFETNVKSIIISTIHCGYEYQSDTYDTLSYIYDFKNNFKSDNKKKYEFKKYADLNLKKINKPKRIKINLKDINVKKRPKTSPSRYTKKNIKLNPLKKIDSKKKDKDYKITENYLYKYYEDISKPLIKNKNMKDDKKYINKNDNIEKYYYKIIDYDDYEDYYEDDYDKDVELINKKYSDYEITKYKNNNFLRNNFNENYRLFKAVNQVLYTRTVKNYSSMASKKKLDNRDILSYCTSTLATLEVVINELKKIK